MASRRSANIQHERRSSRERWLFASAALLGLLILSTIWTTAFLRALDAATVLPFLLIPAAIALAWSAWRGEPLDRALAAALFLAFALVVVMTALRLAGSEERSHLIEYASVAILLREAFRARAAGGRPVAHPAILVFVITLAVGTLDESLQLLSPLRQFEWRDIFVDACAAIFGLIASALTNWALVHPKS
jgi:hypothetical protein